MRYKTIDNYKVLNNENHSIIVNLNNKSWLKVNSKYLDAILELVNKSEDITKKISEIENEKIKSNLETLLKELINLNIVVDENKVHICNSDELHVVSFSVTNRCNMKCSHCCSGSGYDYIDELSTDDLKNIIIKLSEINPDSIDITGGEPLLRNDILQVLEFARKNYNGKILLSTNGTLINEKNIKKICENVDHISISLDGYDEESTKLIRGENIFKKVISTVNKLKENEFKSISLSMLLHDNTYHNKHKFEELCESLEVQPLLRVFTPISRGWDIRSYVDNTLSESIQETAKYAQCSECKPAKRELSVDYNGNVYPCQLLHEDDLCFGNIKDQENILKEIIEEKNINDVFTKLNNIKVYNTQDCKDCNVNAFCGHCVSTYQSYKKDSELFELYCKSYKDTLTESLWGNSF